MSEQSSFQLPGPNLETQRLHKREVFWQITFPLLLVGILVIAVAGMAIWTGAAGDSQWADISLIVLLAVVIFVAIIILIILIGLAVGIWFLNQKTPPYAHLAQNYMDIASRKVEEFSDLLVEPIMRLNGWKAGISAAEKEMFKSGERKKP